MITAEDKQAFRDIKNTADSKEREEKIIQLVREKLKDKSTWLLLFDNVEKFSDIQKYFPHNPALWGKGSVILTTRDQTIQNSSLVDHAINIGELKDHEKYILFKNIVIKEKDNHFTEDQERQTKDFLKKIPPFPLDISLAARYLNATNESYDLYLTHLREYKKSFNSTQENLLSEAGDYRKTRYGIATLSLKHLMDSSDKFTDFLLLISLIDSQNIPRNLLDSFKNSADTSNFIYYLKKQSLITDHTDSLEHNSYISIHRSTQQISLCYLKKLLQLENNKSYLNTIAIFLHKYMRHIIIDGNLTKMKNIAHHAEMFLKHKKLLNKSHRADLLGSLGYLYFNFGEYKKAEHFLEESFETYKNLSEDHFLKMAWVLKNLGELQTLLCRFEEAKYSLEKSLRLYKRASGAAQIEIANVLKLFGEVYRAEGDLIKAEKAVTKALLIFNDHLEQDSKETAFSLKTLGIINRNKGDFIKAHSFLKKSLEIHASIFGKNHIKTSQVSTLLGRNYRNLGYFFQARELLEKNLATYETYYGQNHVDTAEVLFSLGRAYLDLGDTLKAKELCEKSWHIFKNYYGFDHLMPAEAALYLGNVYTVSGDYIRAKEFLRYSCTIYKKNYPSNHIRVAQILQSLADVHLLEGNLEDAEKLIKETHEIFQEKKYSEIYTSLELLSKLYIEKAKAAQKQGKSLESHKFKKLAISYIKEALATVEKYFSIDSPHFIRIQTNLAYHPTRYKN